MRPNGVSHQSCRIYCCTCFAHHIILNLHTHLILSVFSVITAVVVVVVVAIVVVVVFVILGP